MAMPLICPRGHPWTPDDQPSPSAPLCPVCGLAPLPASTSAQVTLEFQPDPLDLAPPAAGDTAANRVTIPAPLENKRDRGAPFLTQHIAGYEILSELGRGGMGIVYKARQLSLNRLVALKMILAGAQADSTQLDRFHAEAEAVARLQHPYIVQIYAISEYDGCPFFSLEYVDGGNLAQKLNGVPQPPRLSAHLVRLLALAMHSAHQKGIIHRDLKPGNILLSTPTQHISGQDSFRAEIDATFRLFGIPKITDFGLAKHLDIQSQTRTGAIIGTPSYMAPEQAEGRAHAIGPATDVYGLGAILYEMLTGRPPFESDSSLTTIRQLLGQDPLPPSHLQRKVPRDLETICLKCLEKDPARRYCSAEELAEDLHRFLDNQPIEARPAGWWLRSFKWMRRHPTQTTVGFVVSLAVLTLLTMGLIYHLNMLDAYAQTLKYAKESQQNLIRLHVAQGTSAMNAGDGFTALLWFTEALRLDAGSPEHEAPHRQRIAALKQGLPRQQQLWVHDGPVNEARFSPDGSRVLTACEDGTIHLWDSETGKETIAPMNGGGMVTFAIFSSDGRRIAAGGSTKTARIWDASTGQPLTNMLPLRDTLRWLDFNPDSQLLATVGGGEVRLWDTNSGNALNEDFSMGGGINVALFSPDGRWLATGDDKGVLRLWDMTTRKLATTVAAHERAILCLAFSPDNKYIASGSSDRMAQVWDVTSGNAVGRHVRHADSILHVAFSPDSRSLLTSSEDGTAQIWNMATSERLVDSLRHKSVVRWAAFSPDGYHVATAGDDNSARVWSASTGAPLTPPLRGNGSVNRVAFSPDGRRLVVASDDGTARMWDIASRQQGRVIDEEGTLFRRRADRDLRVANLDANPQDAGATLLAERTSPDGRFILKLGDDNNTVRVYRVSTGEAVTPPMEHRGEITYAAFSPEGRFVVTTSLDETACVWDAASGAAISPPLRHASGVKFADFAPDGRRLVTASEDNSARIWDIVSGTLLVPPLKHDGTVVRAIFGAMGERVATGSLDQTARVWDAKTGQVLTPPFLHPWPVRRIRFSDDGSRLLTTSPNGSVWEWDLPCSACETQDLIHLAQMLSGSWVDEHGGIMPLASEDLKRLWTQLRQERSDLFTFSGDEVRIWQRQTCEACLRGRNWNAALWYLERLHKHEPDNWLWLAYRGGVQAELGHEKQAQADFEEVVRRMPDQTEAWCMYGVLSLHQGDGAGYRRACAALLKQQEQNANPRVAYLTAWLAGLSADAGVKGEQLVRMAKPALEREPRDPDYLCTLGAALYRSGELHEAAQRLNEALRLRGRRYYVREWLWLALLHARQGSSSEAREWLKKATTALDSSEPPTLPWVQRLQLELLQREAERVLKTQKPNGK